MGSPAYFPNFGNKSVSRQAARTDRFEADDSYSYDRLDEWEIRQYYFQAAVVCFIDNIIAYFIKWGQSGDKTANMIYNAKQGATFLSVTPCFSWCPKPESNRHSFSAEGF